MQNQRTRQITNGALMAAVFTVLLAISVYVPLLNVITILFLAAPAAWYSAKYPWKPAAMFAVGCLFLGFIIGGILTLPLALIYLPFGLMMGLSIHYRKSKLFMFIGSGLVMLLSIMLMYVASIWLLGINVIETFLTALKASYAEGGEWMTSLGGDAEQIERYNETSRQMVTSLEALMPTWLVLTVFITVWIHLLITLPILKRSGIDVPKFPPFRNMRLPKSVLWYYLIILLVSLLSDLEQGTIVYLAFINASMLLQTLLLLQGISFYHFYIKQEGWPKWVTVIVTILAIPLQSFTIIVGIVDLGFDIRGWIKKAHDFKGK